MHSASLFESAATERGRDVVEEAVAAAAGVLRTMPREGDPGSFAGQSGRWRLVRRPEPMLSWGEFFKPHHLVAVFLTTTIEAAAGKPRRLRIRSRQPSRILVAVAGQHNDLFLAPAADGTASDRVLSAEFEDSLPAGAAPVRLALLRIARMAQVSVQLLAALRMPQDVFYPGESISLNCDGVDSPAVGPPTIYVSLLDEAGAVGRQTRAAVGPGAADVPVCPAADLRDGSYALVCQWRRADGSQITALSWPLDKTTRVAAPQGNRHLADRRRLLLEHQAARPLAGPVYRGHIWREVARYALGRYGDVDSEVVRDTCRYVASSVTGSDFEIQARRSR